MWFGSYDGLNRYDGYQVKVFKKQPGDDNTLVFNRITSIAGDTDNRIWIGTMEGVSIFDPVLSRFSTAKFRDAQAGQTVPVRGVNTVKSDRSGDVFIGSFKDGLLVYERKKDSIIQVSFNGDVNYEVTSVDVDEKNTIWLNIRGAGVCRYDKDNGTISVFNSHIKNGTALKSTNDDVVFVGTDNGWVFELGKNGHTVTQIASTGYKIMQFLLQPDGKLWVGADGYGISIFDRCTRKLETFGVHDNRRLSSAAVHDIYIDREDRIWVGTLRGGINILEAQTSRFKTIRLNPEDRNSLPSNFVSSFCEDDHHNIWIGTDGGGLSYWDRNRNIYTNYRHDPGNSGSISGNLVTSLLKDHKQDLWISTWDGGVCRLDRASQTFERFDCFNTSYNRLDKNVWKLFEDKENNIWASTFSTGSLYLFDRRTNTFRLFDENLPEILTIIEDKNGTMWVGDMTTLIKIDKRNKQHTRFRIGNRVRAIYEDRSGRFWVGTEDEGLLLFNRENGTYKRFSEKDGLCSNVILNILEDNAGNLWMSTYNGVTKFNPTTQKFTNYSQSDGLQSNQFSYNAALVLQSGEMMFGGIRGMNIFYPQHIRRNNPASPVVISDIRINNLPLEEARRFISKYNSSEIEE